MAIDAGEKMDESRKSFDLLMNAAGELLIAFNATDDVPNAPLFIYDGRDRGMLYKKQGATPVAFYPLPKEARDALGQATEILCIEVANEHIVAEYPAKFETRR